MPRFLIAAIVLAIFIPPAYGEVVKTKVGGEEFVADYYTAQDAKPTVGVIVLGGSEGGKPRFRAKQLAEAGYPALALAYFKVKGTPDYLDMIPLEYFDQPIDWLADRPEVRDKKIVLVGGSKGGELALLLASRDPRISGVIAKSPSSVVFQGIPKVFWPPRSSWSQEGKPVPYVPYDYSQGVNSKNFRPLYELSLKQEEFVAIASISVEKINGPVLLLSGREDGMWPATEMCESIIERLKAHKFPHAFRHIVYEDAGHTFHESYPLGGSKEGSAKARIDSEQQMLMFLQKLDTE